MSVPLLYPKFSLLDLLEPTAHLSRRVLCCVKVAVHNCDPRAFTSIGKGALSANPISTARQHNHLPGQLIRHVRHASPSCHRPPCQRRHRPLHILLVTSPSPSRMF